jgi:hypothetical protein
VNRPQGTGLGLPISRQIVEHFGGPHVAGPDAGQGACFAFTLPWKPRRAGDRAGAPAAAQETRHDTRILIADDEPNILISLEFLMKREGFTGHVARDGRRRWTASSASARPGAAGRDDARKTGFEVCQELRADEDG